MRGKIAQVWHVFTTANTYWSPEITVQEELSVNKDSHKKCVYMKNEWDYLEEENMSYPLQKQLTAVNQDKNIDHKLLKPIYRITDNLIPKTLEFWGLHYKKIHKHNIRQQGHSIRIKQKISSGLKRHSEYILEFSLNKLILSHVFFHIQCFS